MIKSCEELLKARGLQLNDKKTRIASRSGSQRVTGLVVNEKLQPPRSYQRKVRAIFHQAFRKPILYIERIEELRGHISYLSSFENF